MTGPRPRRPGLQNERTALAWNRTGLALLGLAAVVIRLRLGGPPALVITTVAACALLALGVLLGGIRRYRTARIQAGSDARFPAVIAALIAVLAVVELAGIIRQ